MSVNPSADFSAYGPEEIDTRSLDIKSYISVKEVFFARRLSVCLSVCTVPKASKSKVKVARLKGATVCC